LFSRTPSPRTLLTAGVAIAAIFAAGTGLALARQTGSPASSSQARPTSGAEYAQAVFDAWQSGDSATVIELSGPATAQLLLARSPGDDQWSDTPSCEGAAGSTYCTWTSGGPSLQLRVLNEAASKGAAHAVSEAAFVEAPGAVAIWPFTSQEAADNTQQSVDDGHSPWQLEPSAVATSFAGAVLGWDNAVVETLSAPVNLRVSDATTGVSVDLELAQPSRPGNGGIWAITRLNQAATESGTPTLVQTWDESAVWKPSSVDPETWQAACGKPLPALSAEEGKVCAPGLMQQAGASAEALQFLQLNGYFLESFQELGPVDYGRGAAPWYNMGRPTQQLFLNGTPVIAEMPMDALDGWKVDPSYADVLAADPMLILWQEYGKLTNSIVNPEPGVSEVIEMQVPLRSCRACANVGFAGVRFMFDENGAVSSQTLLPFVAP
jgi:hypothetical protein